MGAAGRTLAPWPTEPPGTHRRDVVHGAASHFQVHLKFSLTRM